MSRFSVVCTGLSFAWPDDTVVFQDLTVAFGPGRSGLVAPNGAGKSTLLRLIAGELAPSAGSVSVDGVLGHLPQTLPLDGASSVADVLGIADVLRAIEAITSGDVRESVFAAVGTQWDAEERARAELDRLGLDDVGLERPLSTLSGGQVVSLGLAAQLLRRPDVLLLDEPTNNLDRTARDRLYDVLSGFRGCLIVVSHDRALLDRMDSIVELGPSEASVFTGSFTDFEAARNAAAELAQRRLRSAELDLRREKRELQQNRERSARRAANGARTNTDIPRIVAGGLKRRAQESAGKADDVHSQRVDAAQSRRDEADRLARSAPALALSLPSTTVPAGRTVFEGHALEAAYAGRVVFSGVDLSIRGPERIALHGANGAGKSTLLRLIASTGDAAYVSQRLDLLDLSRSTIAQLREAAPDRPQTETMHLLAKFLFQGDRAQLPVGALSGGERLRATLLCVLCAEPAPRLLLLDEPTNNLDLPGVDQLASALNAYRGAFVVVSHDEHFLAAIDVTRHVELTGGTLTASP